MLWLRQTLVQNKVFQARCIPIFLAVGIVLPTLVKIMSDCAGSGSGSSCGG